MKTHRVNPTSIEFENVGVSNHQQSVIAYRAGIPEKLRLPNPHTEVLPGVCWGKFDQFFTPAFWVARLWIDGENSEFIDYSMGRSLRDEVAACLLGGYGMPAEVGVAAFKRLRDRGLLNGRSRGDEIEKVLREPLHFDGRTVRYRFPKTKAEVVAAAMSRLKTETPPITSGMELRDWLLTFRGIGPKTASWISRNSLGADDVAILDIHVVRAGLLMGIFSPRQSVQRDYFHMEARLVEFAKVVDVKLSRFDSMIWCYMRRMNRLAIEALPTANGHPGTG